MNDQQQNGAESVRTPGRAELMALADKWTGLARRKFASAGQQAPADNFGKRFIEHGAVCYFNCAQELMDLIRSAEESRTLATQEEPRTPRCQPGQ